MGVYDTVEGQQIKSTPSPSLKSYLVGDHIPLPDGCHLTHEGAFIVRDKHVIAATEVVFTKWGDIVHSHELLRPWDNLAHLIEELTEEEDYDPLTG